MAEHDRFMRPEVGAEAIPYLTMFEHVLEWHQTGKWTNGRLARWLQTRFLAPPANENRGRGQCFGRQPPGRPPGPGLGGGLEPSLKRTGTRAKVSRGLSIFAVSAALGTRAMIGGERQRSLVVALHPGGTISLIGRGPPWTICPSLFGAANQRRSVPGSVCVCSWI